MSTATRIKQLIKRETGLLSQCRRRHDGIWRLMNDHCYDIELFFDRQLTHGERAKRLQKVIEVLHALGIKHFDIKYEKRAYKPRSTKAKHAG